jgi:hypothetical protein
MRLCAVCDVQYARACTRQATLRAVRTAGASGPSHLSKGANELGNRRTRSLLQSAEASLAGVRARREQLGAVLLAAPPALLRSSTVASLLPVAVNPFDAPIASINGILATLRKR